jgi:hypothetical protein
MVKNVILTWVLSGLVIVLWVLEVQEADIFYSTTVTNDYSSSDDQTAKSIITKKFRLYSINTDTFCTSLQP